MRSGEAPAQHIEDAARRPIARSSPGFPRGYLTQFDSYRVIACSAVLLQHSLLWTLAPGNVPGWAFVMLLHFSRTAFFFLTAFLLTYVQLTRPSRPVEFWKRRYVQLGVPYLVWTLIYWVYTLIDQASPSMPPGRLLLHDLLFGYYQLYVVVVMFQLYLVFPLLFRLVARVRHQGRLMVASGLFALALAFAIHWPQYLGPVGHATLWIERYWPWSRDFITYQEQFIAGTLVAMNYPAVHAFVARCYRWVIALAVAVGAGATMWYLGAAWAGERTGYAADLYQPVAFVWFTAVVAALECVTWRWSQTIRVRKNGAPRASIVQPLADLTGGVFFSHVLFISLIRTALASTGVLPHLGWIGRVVLLFACTAAASVLFVSVALRTPLRWVLAGPDRATQRRKLDVVTPVAVTVLHTAATDATSARGHTISAAGPTPLAGEPTGG